MGILKREDTQDLCQSHDQFINTGLSLCQNFSVFNFVYEAYHNIDRSIAL